VTRFVGAVGWRATTMPAEPAWPAVLVAEFVTRRWPRLIPHKYVDG
jgi:hypothetical protein